jgi:RHS repeat-associated protein
LLIPQLDAQGRPHTVRSGYPFGHTRQLWYNGLGAVVAADNLIEQASAEDFTVDGLGNRQRTARPNSRTGGHKDINRVRGFTYDAGGRLVTTVDSLPAPGDEAFYRYVRELTFDLSGNVQSRGESEYDFALSINRNDHLYEYYSADDRLAVANRHLGISAVSDDGTVGQRGVFETHRYDALGRRVATLSLRGTGCTQNHTECFPYLERTVWDGDQLLYELRASRYAGTSSADLPAGGAYNAYGRVLYLHGGGIDAPLAVTRLGLNNQPAAVTTVPHADWTGDYVNGTLLNGTAQSTCTGTSGCPVVLWPGGRTTTDGVPVWAAPATSGWWGSLLQGQADASGLRYQRNRFYDPSTGQFTQEDPIGLAGGRNLYAFAGGDPINFRDPFGLCPIPIVCEAFDIAAVGMDIRDIRQKGLGWGNGLALVADLVAVAVPVLPAGAGALQRAGRGFGDIGGGAATADEILSAAIKWLGDGYTEIRPGVFRSRDNARQFRMTNSDFADPRQGPHVHFEAIGPNGRTIVENSHVPLKRTP